MSFNYYHEDYEEGASAPAQQGVLDDPDADTMRIMVSTDNHLGYEENDSVRGMDSFAAFEEVLYLAKRFRCDMVLLAGDLFHENRPSRRTLYKAMEIIRRYCLGPGAVRIQMTNTNAMSFLRNNPTVNYQDANFAVDLPIFSIHGNHDDPTRDCGDLLAALDLLSISNLVNYFGCQEQVDDVRIYPGMLQKGSTQIALYGLGSMRDERLNRMWREGKVKFFRYQKEDGDEEDEEEEEENEDEGPFNLFVLHQNRDAGRGAKNCVQETLIPEFCDLVVWGHEHECQIELAESLVGTFRISQPGSSVATSLVAGEAVRKKVGILDIKGKRFRIHPVPLTQVRSFVMSDISLREHRANLDPEDGKIVQKVTKVLEEQIKAIIFDAMEERVKMVKEAEEAGSNAAEEDSPLVNRLLNPEKVLIRLRVEHTGFSTISNQRFGAKFVEEIANSDNILLFRKEKQTKKIESKATRKVREAMKKPLDPEELERTNVEDLVSNILGLPESKLELLSEKNLGEALEEYVDKNNLASIPDASSAQLQKRQKQLINNKHVVGKSDDVKEAILEETPRVPSAADDDEPLSPKRKGTKSTIKSRAKKESFPSDDEDDNMVVDLDDEEENIENKRSRASSSKSSGKASSTTTTKPKASASRRKHKMPSSDDDDDDDDIVVIDEPKSKPRSSRRSTKTVNYSVDDGDDDGGNDSDAVVDMTAEEDDDDDDEVMEVEPPKKGRKATSTARGSRKTAAKKTTPRRTTKAASARKTSRRKFAVDSDDEDDDAHQQSIGLDENWGSAATKSQL